MSERPDADKPATTGTQGTSPTTTAPKPPEPAPKTAEKLGTGGPEKKKGEPKDPKMGPYGHDVYPDGFTMYRNPDGTWQLQDPDGNWGNWDPEEEVWRDPETGAPKPAGWDHGHSSHLAIHTEVSSPPNE